MDIKISNILKPRLLTPVAVSLLVLLWTFSISPFTKYGDNWAIYPVFTAAIIIIGWHIYLIIKPGALSRVKTLIYGILHLAIFSNIFMLALMYISKDSL
jgi:hypothetical protein